MLTMKAHLCLLLIKQQVCPDIRNPVRKKVKEDASHSVSGHAAKYSLSQ